MKEMVYKKEFKKKLLHGGQHKGFKFMIYSCGVYPMAYVENKPNFQSCVEVDDFVGVNGGVNYLGKLGNDKYTEYFGWDYGRSGDFIGYYDEKKDPYFATLKKWTTEEILDEVKKCIDTLEKKYIVKIKPIEVYRVIPNVNCNDFNNEPPYRIVKYRVSATTHNRTKFLVESAGWQGNQYQHWINASECMTKEQAEATLKAR